MRLSRDAAGKAHIIAMSGGKDSTAMAIRLHELHPGTPFTMVCTPTGDELPEMFEHWRKIGNLLSKPIFPVMADTLAGCIAKNGALPNWRMRFCTRQLKLEPFKAFMLRAAPCVSYVGLRADESEREGMELEEGPIEQRYPLREWGWGVGKVWAYLDEKGVKIPERTDCARCFFQRLGEWYRLWEQHPDIYEDAVQDEARYGATYRSPGRDTWPAPLAELRKRFKRGDKPEVSLRMMEKRKRMCGVCAM